MGVGWKSKNFRKIFLRMIAYLRMRLNTGLFSRVDWKAEGVVC